ncbi:MAG: RNA polymerase factor sigma-54 [bacterium]
MALSLHQVQRQTQRLIMTPQMQQSIKLLQMNAMDLEQLATQELTENPFLDMAGEEEEETLDRSVETEEPQAEEKAEESAPQETEAETSGDGAAEQSEPEPEPEPALLRGTEDAEPVSSDGSMNDGNMEIGAGKFDDVDVAWEDFYDDSEGRIHAPREEYEEKNPFDFVPAKASLGDYLLNQLSLSSLEGKDLEIAEYMVGCIDGDGYLKEDLASIASALGVSDQKIEEVLRVIQELDPAGVGARNLQECLLLQLRDQNVKDPLIYDLIQNHFSLLEKRKIREIAHALKIDEKKAYDLTLRVARLEPKPGRVRTTEQVRYIEPDIYVKKMDKKYLYILNEGRSGRLRINRLYRQLLQNRESGFSKEERDFAVEKYKAAVLLIRNIEKRKSTVVRVTEAIMDFQKAFLEKGVEHLRPLTLREVAEVVGMHEATVARVTANKYVETPQGLFPLKFFFSSRIETEDGEGTSSRVVKELLAQLIENEPPTKPYSDQKLAKMIQDKGFQIARRTVAKYREQAKILPAKLRKKVF